MNNENDSSAIRATEEAKAVARGALPAEQPTRTVVGHVPPAGDPLPGTETPVHGGADEHGSYTVINGIKTYDRPIVELQPAGRNAAGDWGVLSDEFPLYDDETIVRRIRSDGAIVGAPGTTGTDDFGDFVWDGEGNRQYPNATGDGSTVVVAPEGDLEQIDGRQDIVADPVEAADHSGDTSNATHPEPSIAPGHHWERRPDGSETLRADADVAQAEQSNADAAAVEAEQAAIADNPADEDTTAEAEAEDKPGTDA